jgi:meiotically up-regulated gene 157 (Mug157) protein
MESTVAYWIPVFEILQSHGLEVKLVNVRHVKNVPGRKSDVLDCQWLHQFHTHGLLRGAFRPVEQVCTLCAYVRQRAMLVWSAASYIQRMQKALAQMNLQVHNVVTDIAGMTGMRIIKAITATAHKMARLVYVILKQGTAYVDAGQEYYEKRYRSRVIQNMKRKAQELGFELIAIKGTIIPA